MDDEEDCPNCEDLRLRLKLITEMYEARKLTERHKWEHIARLLNEIVIQVEVNGR